MRVLNSHSTIADIRLADTDCFQMWELAFKTRHIIFYRVGGAKIGIKGFVSSGEKTRES